MRDPQSPTVVKHNSMLDIDIILHDIILCYIVVPYIIMHVLYYVTFYYVILPLLPFHQKGGGVLPSSGRSGPVGRLVGRSVGWSVVVSIHSAATGWGRWMRIGSSPS